VQEIPIFREIDELHHVTQTCQEAVLQDFHIYRNEDADKTCRQEMFLHRCNFFQLSIDKKSSYQLLHNSERIETTDNSIYFTGIGKLISWKVPEDQRSWKGYNIVFHNEFLAAGFNNYNFCKEFPFLRMDNTRSVTIPPNSLIFELCERMLYEQLNKPPDINILKHYLYILLYTVKRIYVQQYPAQSPQQPSRELELAGRFEELIERYYLDFKSINSYASRLFITPKYLSQVTKNVYGKTAKEIIMEKILHEAKSLLVQTDLSLTQIASRLEFTDTSNFIKFFKKLSGEGPTDFRRARKFLP
jgi:AraC family transcriptional regulator, transcriptional activator of pobA